MKQHWYCYCMRFTRHISCTSHVALIYFLRARLINSSLLIYDWFNRFTIHRYLFGAGGELLVIIDLKCIVLCTSRVCEVCTKVVFHSAHNIVNQHQTIRRSLGAWLSTWCKIACRKILCFEKSFSVAHLSIVGCISIDDRERYRVSRSLGTAVINGSSQTKQTISLIPWGNTPYCACPLVYFI
jgi:hypothetical protein